MKPLISVIVPIFNSMDFLPVCLESIKRQEYEPLEIILVDDGSTDGSGELCDVFASIDCRFRVIHKQNGGSSSARNSGIDDAKGQYIAFVDSDDALNEQPYIHMEKVIRETGVDIVCMDRYASKEKRHPIPVQTSEQSIQIYTNVEVYTALCLSALSDAVWDKLFRRELFELRFDVGVINEDFLLMIKLCLSGITLAKTNYVGYYYYLRTGSITGSGFKKNMIDALYNAKFACDNAPVECKESAQGYYLHRILMFLVNMPSEYIKLKNNDYLFAISQLRAMKKSIISSNRSLRDKSLLKLYSITPKHAKIICDLYMAKK